MSKTEKTEDKKKLSHQKVCSSDKDFDQSYRGNGKILLTGEYFVLEGARGIGLPTRLGQSLGISYANSFSRPELTWVAYNNKGEQWFEAKYELWHFDQIGGEVNEVSEFLQGLLRSARNQNKHFLRDEQNIWAETRLEFPRNFGLGSSSTLIYNVAQWAYVSPFQLAFDVTKGSGYDVACAGSEGPILYKLDDQGPQYAQVEFNPRFKDKLFFVHLGQKVRSDKSIINFRSLQQDNPHFFKEVAQEIDDLTLKVLRTDDFGTFEKLVNIHEEKVGRALETRPVKEQLFNDFWGEVKSLGAWGGDFVLATSSQSLEETKKYFHSNGHKTLFTFDELILSTPPQGSKGQIVH